MIGPSRKSGWTAGHLAVLRGMLGAAVVALGAARLDAAAGAVEVVLGAAALASGLLVLAGRGGRAAALLAAGLWLALGARGPLAGQAGVVGGALLLARQALLPAFPLAQGALAAAWIAKAATGAWVPHGWDLLGFALLHWAAFDPAWIPARRADGVERVLYDGSCGLCHRTVRFLLAEDRLAALRFAPLGGETWSRLFPPARAAGLPDSLVVARADGAALVRAAAVAHLLGRLGGWWRPLGALLAALPRPLADFAYDRLARWRRRLFAPPAGTCPLVPESLRGRFLP